MKNYWDRAVDALFSRAHVQPHNHRFFLVSQQLLLAALAFHALFIPLFGWLAVRVLFYFNFVSVAVFATGLFLNGRGRHGLALWLGFFETVTHAALGVMLLGWTSGFYLYLFATGPVLFFNPRLSLARKTATSAIPVGLLIFLHEYTLGHGPVYALSARVITALMDGNIMAIFVLLAYLAYFYSKGADDSERRLRQLTGTLEQMASTDPLTRLLNRRAILGELNLQASRFSRDAQPFVIAIGDIDSFKAINDRHGHAAGDRLLQHVSRLMTERFRQHDRISRWGGEEFLILLPGIRAAEAAAAIGKFQAALAAQPLAIEGGPMALTMTFGLCEFRGDRSIEDCIKRADDALYRGKAAGKNCIVTA